MPSVDPDDDSIRRWVVRHYRYDPDRRERRHVTVGAFDTKREFKAAFDRAQRDVAAREDDGGDRREYISGSRLDPGDRARARVGRFVRRSMEHGVDPWISVTEEELPHNTARYTTTSPHQHLIAPLQRLKRWFRRQRQPR
ncbi:MAG: hypothetical protein ABIQ61_13140 [Ornithinibacter sp.]